MSTGLSRRDLLKLPAAAPFLLHGASGRPNVLMIACDDLNTRIGCWGDPVAKTPNIDRLAARGMRFERAYCHYPLCNPSRTSLLSGLRPDTTKVLNNTTPPRTTIGNVTFLPEWFGQDGYFTAKIGKVAHGAFEDAVKWDISRPATPGPNAKREPGGQKKGKNGKQVGEEGGIKLSWTHTDNKDEDEPDGHTARTIVEIMEQNLAGKAGAGGGKPFFLGAGFHKPHLPWVAPKRYFDMYPPEQIHLPDTPANDRDDIPPIALTHTAGDDLLTDLDKKKCIASYHACTTFLDAQIGVLLDALDRNKLWDNTVVILWADHGWHLDEHLGLWRKMTVFEEASHVPLIVAAPGMQRGAVCRRLAEWTDIYPTMTQLCGLANPPGLEGISLVPLLKDPARPWKKAAATVVKHRDVLGRSVRTERYRYTEWGSPQVAELYDHEQDPYEFTNLAMDSKSATLRQDLRRFLVPGGWKAALPST
jgi:iduronate 2-sulfatase